MGTVFGPIVTGGAVERAVAATLAKWMHDYLGEVERIEGYEPDAIERPRGIVTSSEFAKWPEDQLPVVLVLSAGLGSPPTRRGDGHFDASWLVGLAPVVSDVNADQTRRLALSYAAAVRAAIMHHRSLDGFASALAWRDENYGDLPFDDTRSLGSGRVVFEITVENVVRDFGGPPAPTPTPDPTVDPGNWPEATLVTTGVTPEPITEAV